MGYTCAICGRHHHEELRDVRAGLPEAIFALPEDERRRRAIVAPGGDFATLDGGEHYVRALLEIPMPEDAGAFCWGVWVRLSEEDVRDVARRWLDEGSAGRSYRGTLGTRLPAYGETLGLPGTLTLAAADRVPSFALDPSAHPLALEQRAGVSLARARELAEPYRRD